jgi:hypothetical protein
MWFLIHDEMAFLTHQDQNDGRLFTISLWREFRIGWLVDPRGPLHSYGVMGLKGRSKGAQGYFGTLESSKIVH